eukprot:CAMPEP_0197594908 /NCGR_PEP_ID=MMETSP1326-20131121/21684_1 /TAXON_ID=1155430 /ORGANISM="Genus nov. species nov., Strain RCC2288" /LENGTH=132 /DNA_ID=CAMNT_0043161173 /DNA_START=51 /DNA_END=449 /DNA_ORIENTATION=-
MHQHAGRQRSMTFSTLRARLWVRFQLLRESSLAEQRLQARHSGSLLLRIPFDDEDPRRRAGRPVFNLLEHLVPPQFHRIRPIAPGDIYPLTQSTTTTALRGAPPGGRHGTCYEIVVCVCIPTPAPSFSTSST